MLLPPHKMFSVLVHIIKGNVTILIRIGPSERMELLTAVHSL